VLNLGLDNAPLFTSLIIVLLCLTAGDEGGEPNVTFSLFASSAVIAPFISSRLDIAPSLTVVSAERYDIASAHSACVFSLAPSDKAIINGIAPCETSSSLHCLEDDKTFNEAAVS
jgi:hypothetical protein